MFIKNKILDRCCSVLAQNFPYQSIIERANWPEFPPDLRARLAAHSFPKSARQIRNYYGVPKISAKEVKQIGFRVIGKMWAGQQVCLDVDRGAIIRAECSCGGEVGLCQHQLATVTARIEQETKTRNKADILDGIMVSEPLSDTVLRMSREQLAAALLEIASPQKSPWLVSEVHDVVSIKGRDVLRVGYQGKFTSMYDIDQ